METAERIKFTEITSSGYCAAHIYKYTHTRMYGSSSFSSSIVVVLKKLTKNMESLINIILYTHIIYKFIYVSMFDLCWPDLNEQSKKSFSKAKDNNNKKMIIIKTELNDPHRLNYYICILLLSYYRFNIRYI